MNAVSKNIRRLRMRDGFSQEVLAERLNVTRQAVSSWETGKTQPDIDTLIAIAAAFGVEVTEVIYGERQPASVPDRKKYKRAAVIFNAATLIFILLEIFLVPYLKILVSTRYIAVPFYTYMFFISPVFFMCVSFALFNTLSLAYDLRFKGKTARKVLVAAGCAIIAFHLFASADYFFGMFPLPVPMFYYIITIMKNQFLFLIPGTALFFGLNK